MKDGLPVVLISGNNFVAKKLVESFLMDEVFVVVLDKKEKWVEYADEKLLITNNIGEIDFRIDYVFDFDSKQIVWSRAEVDESRLVVIGLNNTCDDLLPRLRKKSVDWRLLVGYDVFGPGMSLEENWVSRVMETAVLNKNLEIPKENGSLRCIFVDDFVKVVKKCCFVPGLTEEKIVIFGKKVSIDVICRTLVNKAKMTKKGAVVKNRDMFETTEKRVREGWDKIGWDGGGGFEAGVGETLQYLFSEIDLILRGKKKRIEIKKRRTPTIRVEIEEENLPRGIYETKVLKVGKKKKKKVVKKVEMEIDDMDDVVIGKAIKKQEKEEYKKYEWTAKKRGENRSNIGKNREDEIDLSQLEIKPAWGEKMKVKDSKKEKKEVRTKKEKLRIFFGGLSLKKVNWKLVVLPIMGLVTVYAMLLISFFGGLWRMSRVIDRVRTLVENGQVAEGGILIDKNITKINRLEKQLKLASFEGRMFSYKGWSEVLRVLETTMDLEKELLGFFENSAKYGEAIFEEGEIDWEKEELELKNKLAILENRLGMLEARTKGDWSFLPNRIRLFIFAKSEEVTVWRELVSKIRAGMDSFFYIMAIDGGRRDFLVLMQNEMELRPTGGFIGSFGVLSFEDGQFLSLEISDIYDIDGQLKGHVEPPVPIKEILGEASWYLRDANWKADFSEAAVDMEWFFKKETGREIDGIISINLSVAKAILDEVGEVWVPDFDENINSNNLFDQAEFYSENSFFAGSRQKSTFLGKLSGQLMEEIKNQKGMGQIGLIRAILDSLDKNEMQIYLKDKEKASALADLGWDGSMYSGGCSVENCVADYLYMVEANLGVNKANYFLKRSIDKTVDISDRAVTRVVKVSYENMSRTTAWPGGDYKNYMRVYVPADVNISEVSIYDSDDTNNRRVLGKKDLEVKTVGDKKELAFLVTVPVTKKRTVEMRYSSQIDLNTFSDFSYLSYVQKQSGYGDTPIVSLVSYPDAWLVIQVEPAATVVNGKLLFSEILDRDLSVGVVISK